MNSQFNISELVRFFNEDEAVWRSFEQNRELRRRFHAASPLSEEILDAIDWREAEREHRKVRCIGFFMRSD